MDKTNFDFKTQWEQSAIKTELVIKYFNAWAKIMLKSCKAGKIGYVDLFCGPGIFEDGNESTPIYIIKNCIKDDDLRKSVAIYLNDKTPEYVETLKENINKIPGINTLKYKPSINNIEVDKDFANAFSGNLIPCMSFVDPTGFSGLTLDLIHNLTKDFGSDIIFFFNYNEINRFITNPNVLKHMKYLFGETDYNLLIENLKNIKNPHDRELIIINSLSEALKKDGLEYVLPFRFQSQYKNRTSHYLIFASKCFTGYDIMKQIMWKAGEKDGYNVGKFEFIPTDSKSKDLQLSLIDMFSCSLEDLKKDLLDTFKGKSILLRNLYKIHGAKGKFILPNYKDVLLELEEKGIIKCEPSERPVRKGKKTMNPEKVTISFPN